MEKLHQEKNVLTSLKMSSRILTNFIFIFCLLGFTVRISEGSSPNGSRNEDAFKTMRNGNFLWLPVLIKKGTTGGKATQDYWGHGDWDRRWRDACMERPRRRRHVWEVETLGNSTNWIEFECWERTYVRTLLSAKYQDCSIKSYKFIFFHI